MNLKLKIFIGSLILSLACLQANFAFENAKIAMVNMNRAINESESGKRSKKLLESKFKEYEQSLKDLEKQVRKIRGELSNALLLKADAKKQKEVELNKLTTQFQQRKAEITGKLREDEARYTENIFKDLKDVIASIAKQKKLDMVVEAGTSPLMLYTKFEIENITEEVILEFNKRQK